MVSTTEANVIIKPTTARDEVEEKVLKNRLAQKKFREKKEQKYKELMQRVEYLEKMNKELKNSESLLKKQIEELKQTSNNSASLKNGGPTGGSDKAHNFSEDELSLSGTSFKGSEDLSQVYGKTVDDRKSSQGIENSFSFPWGKDINEFNKPYLKKRSTGSINTLANSDFSLENSLNEENPEFNFNAAADENVFCNNLGDACPYTPSGLNKSIGQSTLETPLHISADLLDGEKAQEKPAAGADGYVGSRFNNLDSVFGMPNFSFSPSAFEGGLESKETEELNNFFTDDTDFVGKQPLGNDIEDDTSDLFEKLISSNMSIHNSNTPSHKVNDFINNSIDITNNVNEIISKHDSAMITGKSSLDMKEKAADKPSIEEEDENLVVPSDGKFFTCSEIWDRITSNPKLSDIDLDNLCMELKTKAKCSERGVLVKEEDLNKALRDHEIRS